MYSAATSLSPATVQSSSMMTSSGTEACLSAIYVARSSAATVPRNGRHCHSHGPASLFYSQIPTVARGGTANDSMALE